MISKLTRYTLPLAFLASTATPIFAAEKSPPNVMLAARVDRYLAASVANGFSGAVLLARGGEVVLSKGYGLSDRERGIPVDSSTVFNIGSVTKQFTAAAILKLVAQGKVETTDTLSRFFANVPEDKKGVTLHQLLTHTAGISPRTGGPRYDRVTRAQSLHEIFEAPLDSEPGARHDYANAGYILLAAVVETASGQDFERFLRKELFDPAGMTSTGYSLPGWTEARLAHGYYFSLADAAWLDWGTTPERWGAEGVSWYGIGKGDLHSTVEDLYKWHLALQNDSILPRNLRELYETPQVPENSAGTSHYGYGWAIRETERGTKVVSHNGSNGIYFADFVRFVDEGVVIVFLTNVARPDAVDGVASVIAKMVFDPEYESQPIPPFGYELVYRFIEKSVPGQVEALPAFMERNQGRGLEERRVLNQIGYQLLKEHRCDWSIALLRLNTRLFPDDGNLFDSLGEAALECGRRELAVESLERALALAPAEDCGWCESSRRHLQQTVGDDAR